jgi:hypothetical protein
MILVALHDWLGEWSNVCIDQYFVLSFVSPFLGTPAVLSDVGKIEGIESHGSSG